MAKKINIIILLTILIQSKYNFAQIENINGLSLWLRSDSGVLINQNKVYEWQDMSGNNIHFTQSIVHHQPVYINQIDSLNSKPALYFNNSFLSNSQHITIGTIYILCNYEYNTFQDYCGLLTQATVSDGSTDYLLVSSPGNTFFYPSILNQGLFINQQPTYNFAPLKRPKIIKGLLQSPITWNSIKIGNDRSYGGRFWTGYVFEIIIFNRALTLQEQNIVETYLMNKYAPSINLPNDTLLTTFCPYTINPQGYYINYQWNTDQQSNSIVIQQSGTYYVTATDIFGRQSIDSIKVIFPNPNIQPTYILCHNDSIVINTQLNPSFFNFLWNDSSNNPYLVVNNVGQYWVSITDSAGCEFNSDTINVLMDNFYLQNILPDSIALCLGDTLSAYNSAAISYTWNINSNEYFIIPTYSGWYKVTVQNTYQCLNIDSCYVTIKGQKPIPHINKNTTCLNATGQYLATSTGNIQQYIWYFHDTMLYGNVVHYNYSDTGIYPVTLQVIDSNTCQSFITISDTVYPNPNSNFIVKQSCNNNELILQSLCMHEFPIQNYIWYINENIYYGNSISVLVNNNTPIINIIEDVHGCKDTVIKYLNHSIISTEVKPAQIIYPTINQNIYTPNVLLQFNNFQQLSSVELSYFNNFTNPFFQTSKSYQQSYYVNNLEKNKLIYGRIWTYNECNDSTYTTFTFKTYLPDSIHNLSLWLRSDTGVIYNSSLKVLQWQDFSGNQRHLDTISINLSPNYINYIDSIAGLPSLRFHNSALVLNSDITTGTLYIIANYVYSNFLNYSGLFTRKSVIDGNSDYLLVSNNSNTTFYTSILNELYINQQQTSNFAPLQRPKIIKGLLNDSVQWADIMIGLDRGIGGRFWLGNIWEIILFERKLTVNEQNIIENYLMDKYAPPVLLPPDTMLNSFCPFTIKPKGYFTSYLWNTGANTDSIVVNSTGKYVVTATDIFGRQSIDSIIVTFPQINIPDIVTVCHGDSVLVASSLGNFVNYLWSNGGKKNYSYVKNEGWHSITITDKYQCSFIDSFFVDVDSLNLTALFTEDTLNLCIGNVLSIQNIPYSITQYLWLPNNDTTSTIVVNQSQQYVVEIVDNYGCTAKDSVYVNIIGTAPLAQFTHSHTCFGDSTTFLSTSIPLDTSNIIFWEWIINNQDTLFGQQAYYMFANYGQQIIKLHIQTNSGCSQFVIDTILVYPIPNNHFTVHGLCEQQQTQFLSTVSIPFGSVVDYFWNFGDGNVSYHENPVHTYQQMGNYTVSFTAISNEGCSKTISKQIEIKYKPKAGFYHGASCVQSPTFFTDTSKTLSHLPIIQWKWDFGNGITSSQQNPVHYFNQVGTYQTSLSIKIVNGCTDEAYKTVVVSSTPQAYFVHDSACLHQPLHIIDSSHIINGQIVKWNWYIGNSYFSNQPNITVIPQQTGSLTILQIVESNTHCLDTFVKILNVKPKPLVQFNANPTYGSSPLLVQFENLSEAGQSLWNFGDGNTSILNQPQHTYTDTGIYTVWLIHTNLHGCYDSVNKVILVVPNIIDLSVEDILFYKQENYLIVSVKIANTGTLPIENPELQLWANGRFLISENLSDTIFSGDKLWYTFNGKINTNYIQPIYLCVIGKINKLYQEISTENNTSCKAIEEAEQILNIYPNPTNNFIIVEFHLLEQQDIILSIVNVTGKEILKIPVTASKDYNRLQIDVSSFSNGLYILQLQSKNMIFVHKFFKY